MTIRHMDITAMENNMRLKHIFVATSTLIVTCTSAYALNYVPGKAHHPIHIKKTPAFMHQQPSGLTPIQVRTAYGFNKIAAQGKGQTIAIVDAYDDAAIESDLAVFNTAFDLPACTTQNKCFTKIYANGTQPPADSGWAGEIALDVEWAHAIAPQAKIILVEANSDSLTDLFQAVQVAINSGANVISMSWGGGEDSSQLSLDNIFKSSTAAFTASSGDSGYGVSYPASSPYVIAVGGTTLNIADNGSYVSETAWSGSGGGISTIEAVPAFQQSYPIPNNPTLKRGVPDVSYNADPNSGVSVYNSIPDQNGQSGWEVVGGTSAGAPQWAALIAVTNSTVRKTIPDVGALLYKLAKRKYDMTFYDVTSGTNGDCGYYCQAGVNYDYVTGLGSPHALYLVNMMIRGGNFGSN